MTCNVCGGKTTVIDTGSTPEYIIRRRKCLACGNIFYTLETDYDNTKEASKMLNDAKKEKKNA